MVVQLDRVTKTYAPRSSITQVIGRFVGGPSGEVTALTDVSLAVHRGDSVGLVGGNGSGKSTLLRLIAGLTQPTHGSLVTTGKVATLLDLGAGVDPDRSGSENIELMGTLAGLDRGSLQRHRNDIESFSGLGADLARPVREYSAGMFVRLAFSIATAVQADLLVVDEVLAVGDARFRAKCQEWLATYLGQGGTLVAASHDPAWLVRWCRRVVWLEGGRIRREGDPRTIVGEYLEATLSPGLESGTRDQEGSLATRNPRISRVALHDGSGASRHLWGPADTMSVVVDYVLPQDLEGAVVGVMISRSDWTCCFGTDTRNAGLGVPRRTDGSGTLRLDVDPLQLLPGSYIVSASVATGTGQILDMQWTAAVFTVASGPPEAGLFRPTHRWVVPPEGHDAAL